MYLSKNINYLKILGYLEYRVGDNYYFEYYTYKGSELNSDLFEMEKLLKSQTYTLEINNARDIKKVLLPNYYYDIEISNKQTEISFYLDAKDNREFYRKFLLEENDKLFVSININHNVTNLISSKFAESKKLLEKMDSLKKCLLNVYINGKGEEEGKNNYNKRYDESYIEWLMKKNQHNSEIIYYLDLEFLNENDIVGFDTIIKKIIPKFSIDDKYRWDKLSVEKDKAVINMISQKYSDLRGLLQKIKTNEYLDKDLKNIYVKLLSFDGIGIVSMSILLNIINNKYFPIYTRGLSKYMEMVGFKINPDKELNKHEKNATIYSNYQIYLNQMFKSFGNYLNDHRNSYDDVNYYLRKELDLFKL